ncbi:hypothetical protein JW766_05605 [Candidatus Dojkabacteria bacterium]|nr:hypothetical protein [Candidatus Dojkabacteria bacterium]
MRKNSSSKSSQDQYTRKILEFDKRYNISKFLSKLMPIIIFGTGVIVLFAILLFPRGFDLKPLLKSLPETGVGDYCKVNEDCDNDEFCEFNMCWNIYTCSFSGYVDDRYPPYCLYTYTECTYGICTFPAATPGCGNVFRVCEDLEITCNCGACYNDAGCNDGNNCTLDSCDIRFGTAGYCHYEDACSENEICTNNQCVNRFTDPSNCGWNPVQCAQGEVCIRGQCVPDPNCQDTCSSLGYHCGNHTICSREVNCGTCPGGYSCNASGICVFTCNDTCQSLGLDCGTHMICGQSTTCGSCPSGYRCNSASKCERVQTCSDSCSSLSKECGNHKVCDQVRNCGTCPDGEVCNSYGACVKEAQCRDTCESLNAECGERMICDKLVNCGECDKDEVCNAEGTCEKKKDKCDDTCESLGYECGVHEVCDVLTHCGYCDEEGNKILGESEEKTEISSEDKSNLFIIIVCFASSFMTFLSLLALFIYYKKRKKDKDIVT